MTMRMKALACVIAVAATCTLVTASAVIAASGRPKAGQDTKAVDRQTIVWRTGKRNRAYTRSAHWSELPMPSGGCTVGADGCSGSSFDEPLIDAKGPLSLTFSGVFSRAPVQLRFRDGG